MKSIIKKILKEYIENRSEKDDFMRRVDYAQKKAIKNSEHTEETKKLDKLKDKLKNYRTTGLEKKGEFSYENLVFKFLRRNGYIEKLFDFYNKLQDKNLSLTERLKK